MTQFFSGVGGSLVIGPASGGKIYAFNNIGVTPTVVAPVNPQRTSVTFYNPGASGVLVSPVVVQALNTVANGITNQVLNPTPSALGGCFVVYPNGGQITIAGECAGAYQAFCLAGTTNPLTVSDSNV